LLDGLQEIIKAASQIMSLEKHSFIKGYWLTAYYDLKLRIAQQNQAGFTEKIFLERAGIDLGFPRMLARRSSTELSKLDTSKGKINWI